ncbi:transposase [Roseiflexus sp. RS-1]|uniref:transposase n=1 Tax=Roseiflexus sp. (strain RS-1) TaxID=357808 RepID=UPI003FA694BB
MVHAIVPIVRRGCAWCMLPRDVPPGLTVYPSVRRWRKDAIWARRTDTLRMDVRRASGREKELGDQEYRRRRGRRAGSGLPNRQGRCGGVWVCGRAGTG